MTVEYVPDLGHTPARVNRRTGNIQISLKHWREIPKEYHDFITEHEVGHYLEQTRDEQKADEYALYSTYGQAPESLKNSIKSLSRVLTFSKPGHIDRLNELYKKALKIDWEENQNAKAINELKRLESKQPMRQFTPYATNPGFVYDSDFSNFSWKKTGAKLKKIGNSKAAKLLGASALIVGGLWTGGASTGAGAKLLSKLGSKGGKVGDLINKGSEVAGMFKGSQGNNQNSPEQTVNNFPQQNPDPLAPKSNTMLYIGAAVAIVVIVVLIIIFTRKNK